VVTEREGHSDPEHRKRQLVKSEMQSKLAPLLFAMSPAGTPASAASNGASLAPTSPRVAMQVNDAYEKIVQAPTEPTRDVGVDQKYAKGRFYKDRKKPLVVSDVRDAFYRNYGVSYLPMGIGSFVSEMLSGMTLVLASPAFAYSRVFALGFKTLCKTFIRSEQMPDEERRARAEESILLALGLDPKEIDKDAEALTSLAKESTEDQLFATDEFRIIQSMEQYKYSYQFGAGLLQLMQHVGEKEDDATIYRWSDKLGIRSATLKKDAAYFQSIIKKMDETKEMLLQMQASAKKKEAAGLKAEAEVAEKAAMETELAEKKKEAARLKAEAEVAEKAAKETELAEAEAEVARLKAARLKAEEAEVAEKAAKEAKDAETETTTTAP
jgi:hypothetical protein